MNAKQVSEAFEKLAVDAVLAAEQIDCTLQQFSDGLVELRDALQERLDLVRDEIRSKAGLDDEEDDEDDEA